MSPESLMPRGFARSGIVPDSDHGESRVLMMAYPSMSFVTIYLPNPELAATERMWWWYQLGIAGLEEISHSAFKRTGGIRNVYLLERKSREELAYAHKKPVEKAKAAIVRAELGCERLYDGMYDLVETHDKFVTCFLDEEGRPNAPGFGGDALKRLSQRMETDPDTVNELISKQMVASAREINPGLFDDLLELREASKAVGKGTFLPLIAVNLALDIPYFIAPLSAPNTETVPAEGIDFMERFNALVEVFCTDSVRREISDCTTKEQLVDVAFDAVIQESTVQIPSGVPYAATEEFTFPLLDVAFDPETAKQKLSNPMNWFSRSGGSTDLDNLKATIEGLFSSYGCVAVSGRKFPPVCFQNPGLYTTPTNQSIYGRFWVGEFVYRDLVEQVLQRTVDRENVTIQNPLDRVEISGTAAENWQETVTRVRQVAEAFQDVTVDGETELRRCRLKRRQHQYQFRI